MTDKIRVTTSCIRNTEHCLTYSPSTLLQTNCSDGSPTTFDSHTEFVLPHQPANPIPRLTGTRRDVFADPCPGTQESDVVLERIGD
jgi:hypothetical protein